MAATRQRKPKAQRPWLNPHRERPKVRELPPGPGRYVVLRKDREIAYFEEFSGPEGAKAYLDAEILPTGSEIVRRKDGVVLAYLSKSTSL